MFGVKTIWLFSLLVAFVLGAGAMYFFEQDSRSPFMRDVTEGASKYKFINPLLFCQDQGLNKFTNATSNKIEEAIGKYIQEKKNSGELTDAAVYFRDLNTGPWALVNRQLRSAPSSLLKVPLAISIYRHKEDKDPEFLKKEVAFGGGVDIDQGQYFKPAEQVMPNFTYTVGDLVNYMVADSDNTALYLLSSQLNNDELLDTYEKLGIDPPVTDKAGYTLDVRTIASFFRVLYNASYLSNADSESLLQQLSQSKFTQGIVAGIGTSTPAAHKFGEAKSPDGKLQLHDCGIVYKPGQPYLLCVVTHGQDYAKLADVIAHISQIVWGILAQN
jgi:hypothetical protein